jgi:Gly-Xaa carboxypeptidase
LLARADDGDLIWGRGSVDDKSGLIGIMSAVESILGTDFAPKRTVVLAFGFDEGASTARARRSDGQELDPG